MKFRISPIRKYITNQPQNFLPLAVLGSIGLLLGLFGHWFLLVTTFAWALLWQVIGPTLLRKEFEEQQKLDQESELRMAGDNLKGSGYSQYRHIVSLIISLREWFAKTKGSDLELQVTLEALRSNFLRLAQQLADAEKILELTSISHLTEELKKATAKSKSRSPNVKTAGENRVAILNARLERLRGMEARIEAIRIQMETIVDTIQLISDQVKVPEGPVKVRVDVAEVLKSLQLDTQDQDVLEAQERLDSYKTILENLK